MCEVFFSEESKSECFSLQVLRKVVFVGKHRYKNEWCSYSNGVGEEKEYCFW